MSDPESNEPTQDEVIEDSLDEEDDEYEIPINERKLLWTVVAVLAVFAVVEGLTIVSWGSRIRRLEQQVQGGVAVAQTGGGGGGQGASQGGPPPGGGEKGPPPGGGDAVGGGGDGSLPPPMVTGRAAEMMRVDEFIVEKELDEAMAESLRVLMEDSERKLEALPTKEATGEITSAERITILEGELVRREQEAFKLLGDELATALQAKLTTGGVKAGAEGSAPPPPPPPPGEDKKDPADATQAP